MLYMKKKSNIVCNFDSLINYRDKVCMTIYDNSVRSYDIIINERMFVSFDIVYQKNVWRNLTSSNSKEVSFLQNKKIK